MTHFLGRSRLLLVLGSVVCSCEAPSGESEARFTGQAPSAQTEAHSTLAQPSANPAPVYGTLPVSGPTRGWAFAGVGEKVVDNTIEKHWPLDLQLDKVIALHPKVFRLWVTSDHVYKWPWDWTKTVDTEHVQLYQHAVNRLTAAGIQVMGMDTRFPAWMTGANWGNGPNDDSAASIPCPGSTYYEVFLDRYERHWVFMAEQFPGISLWEPANEINHHMMLQPIHGACGKAEFTFEERVRIGVDLMERATRAIHSKNPSAIVFVPPPTTLGDNGLLDPTLTPMRRYLEAVYAEIAQRHGNKRDYFGGVSWHPYTFQAPTMESWVAPNEAIFEVMVRNGDATVPVVFSELGNSEHNANPFWGSPLADGGVERVRFIPHTEQQNSEWMQETFRLTQQFMPWVSHVIWFRLFDDPGAYLWFPNDQELSHDQATFGVMHALDDAGTDFPKKVTTDTLCKYTGCAPEPFRAWVVGQGWSSFWVHGTNYCRYTDAAHFQQKTGMDWSVVQTYLPVLDVQSLHDTGICH